MSTENESPPAEESAGIACEAPRSASPEVIEVPNGLITIARLREIVGLSQFSDDDLGSIRAAVEETTGELIHLPDVLTQFVTALDQMPGVDEQEKLRQLVDASFGPGIDCVRDQLVSKFESYNGRALTADQIESAISGYSEVLEHLDGDALSIDLGAFALFGQKASIEQNIAVQRAQEVIINDFEARYGLMVLKSRAGDCYVAFIPRLYSDKEKKPEYDVQRMLVLTQELAKAMGQIEMPVESIKKALGKDGEPLYEIREALEVVEDEEGNQRLELVKRAYFKVTVAVADASKGKVQHSINLGSMAGGQGLFRLRGGTLSSLLTIENKKGVSKGHARFDKATITRIQKYYPDVKIVDGQIHVMGEDIEFGAVKGFSLADDRTEMGLIPPAHTGAVTNAELLAALVALQATTTTGAPKRFAGRCSQTERNDALSSETGRVALGVQVGSAQEEALNPEKYDAFYRDLVDLVSEPRFTNRFQMLKHDESWVILSSRGNGASLDLSNEQDLKLLLVLQIALGSLLQDHQLTAKVASSAGSSRFSIPSPGVVAEDWYWEDVVNLARLLKGTEFEGILVHSNVCMKAAGTLGFLEFLSQEFKGIGLVQFLRLHPEMEVDDVLSQIMSQDLLGVEGVIADLDTRLNDPSGHGLVSLMGPTHDPNGRYGKSALLRHFALQQKQIIGPKLKPVMLYGVNTLGTIMEAVGYEYTGSVAVAYGKMLREQPELFNGHLLLCDPSVELDETTKSLLKRTGAVLKGQNALLIWAGVEEGEVLRLSPLSLDDATKLVARTKGIPEEDTTTIAFLRTELGTLGAELIHRLTPPFVLHQLSAAVELKRDKKTNSVDSIILHRDRLSTTGTGSSALETQAEALNLDTDVRGVYGLIASLRAPLSRANVLSMVMATLELSEARAAFAIDRLLEVGWITDEGVGLTLVKGSHREGAMHLHTYDFRGAAFAAEGLKYFPSSKSLESMTLDEQYTELGLRLQAETVDVARLRELTAVVALAYYKAGQIAEARSIYHRYFEKVGQTRLPLGLDEKGVEFYLNAATVLRQGASRADHKVAIALLKSLIGYVGITELQRQKVFFALSRMMELGLNMDDSLQGVSSELEPLPYKADEVDASVVKRFGPQRELCGKLLQLILSFPSLSSPYGMKMRELNILIYKISIAFCEAHLSSKVEEDKRVSLREDLRDMVRGVNQIFSRFESDQDRNLSEGIATASRLLGGLMNLLDPESSEGNERLLHAQKSYLGFDIPDYRQANSAAVGVYQSRRLELMRLSDAAEARTNKEEALAVARMNAGLIFDKIYVLMEDLNAFKDECLRTGDLKHWNLALTLLHNVYLVLLFTMQSVGQSTSSVKESALSNLEAMKRLQLDSGVNAEAVEKTFQTNASWIDAVT